MAEVYGHRWTSSYGTVPNQSWVDGLADLTPDEVRAGLVRLKTWEGSGGWPPTMFEFRALCRPVAAPAHEAYVALPVPEGDFEDRKSVAMLAVQSLREGCFKAIEQQKHRLSDEGRSLLPALDGDPIALELAREIMARPSGCTCDVRKDPTRGATVAGACEYCRRIAEAMRKLYAPAPDIDDEEIP